MARRALANDDDIAEAGLVELVVDVEQRATSETGLVLAVEEPPVDGHADLKEGREG